MNSRLQWKLNAPKRQSNLPASYPISTNLDTYSLEALEAFIQTQRTLLERTQTDITRLRELRNDVITQPDVFVSDVSDKVQCFTPQPVSVLDLSVLFQVERQFFSS